MTEFNLEIPKRVRDDVLKNNVCIESPAEFISASFCLQLIIPKIFWVNSQHDVKIVAFINLKYAFPLPDISELLLHKENREFRFVLARKPQSFF